MKVNRITLWSVDLTSHETYYMAEGKTCPIPNYLPAFADGVPSAIAEMAPEILGWSRLASTLCCASWSVSYKVIYT